MWYKQASFTVGACVLWPRENLSFEHEVIEESLRYVKEKTFHIQIPTRNDALSA